MRRAAEDAAVSAKRLLAAQRSVQSSLVFAPRWTRSSPSPLGVACVAVTSLAFAPALAVSVCIQSAAPSRAKIVRGSNLTWG
ncbi:hypothetical protein PF003_g40015 [Phytophthora fragariae]|nr:hypothetical protein PF003_g40015 [Phytophthora fragariae]